MEIKRYVKMFAGYTHDNILTFDIELRENFETGKTLFTMSANCGRLIKTSDYTYDMCKEMFLENLDPKFIKQQLEYYEYIDLNELLNEELSNYYYDKPYRMICDCSCTDYEFEVGEETYNFETESCGQCCDILGNKEYGKWIIYPYAKRLLQLWKMYHLKTLHTNIEKEIMHIMDMLEDNYPSRTIEEDIIDIFTTLITKENE